MYVAGAQSLLRAVCSLDIQRRSALAVVNGILIPPEDLRLMTVDASSCPLGRVICSVGVILVPRSAQTDRGLPPIVSMTVTRVKGMGYLMDNGVSDSIIGIIVDMVLRDIDGFI